MTKPCFEAKASDEASKEAAEASKTANREQTSAAHLEAANKHKKAAWAARAAETELRSKRLPIEATAYGAMAEHHDSVEQLHEDRAKELSSKGGHAIATAKGGFRSNISPAAKAIGAPCDAAVSTLTATAKAFQHVHGSDSAKAMDAYLRTPAGDAEYQAYRESIIRGRSGLPTHFASRQ